ncbi:MAG: chemotaxis protein CheA, partial [Bradymonadaceae bacterium]
LLSLIRDRQIDVSTEVIDTLFDAVDATYAILEHIEEAGEEPDQDWGATITKLQRLQSVTPEGPADGGAEQTEGERSDQNESTAVDAEESEPGDDPASKPSATEHEKASGASEAEQTGALSDRTDSKAMQGTVGSQRTVRVDVDLLDAMMNQMSELILTRNQLQRRAETTDQLQDSSHQTAFRQLDVVTSQLQQTVMEARMQPIRRIWTRYPRMVRDLAQEHDKQVNFETSGGDTELDKNLVESISDPITHLVRNAVDHGLESPETRTEAGKPPTGTLRLEAFQQRGQVVVRVSDDGRGIDRKEVEQRAIEQGLANSGHLEQLSDEQLYQFLFSPGFSTSRQVTDVSGRGVGLEVVKRNIEQAGGTVSVDSTPGQGTVFELRFPLTLAVVSALTVGCQGQEFVIPQQNVLRLVGSSGTDTQVDFLHETPVYQFRDRLLPITYLDRLLGYDHRPPRQRLQNSSTDHLVLLETGRTRFALAVDRVHDTEERVVKSLSEPLESIGVYMGATLRGDGQPVLILDPEGLVARADISRDYGQSLPTPEVTMAEGAEIDEPTSKGEEVLFCRSRDDGRIAIPLVAVQRLAQIADADIERHGHVDFARYDEAFLPLVTVEDVLPERRDEPRNKQVYRRALNQSRHPVVIYEWEERLVVLVMTEFVEVLETSLEDRYGVSRPGIQYCTEIADQITEVLDIPTILEQSPLNPQTPTP